MAEFELCRSEDTNSRGEYHWSVLPAGSHMPAFSPNQSGDASLRACETWLKNRGAVPCGNEPPHCFIYRTTSTRNSYQTDDINAYGYDCDGVRAR